MRATVKAVLLQLVVAVPLLAQDATVFHTHRFRTEKETRNEYQPAGSTSRLRGVPKKLLVPEGGRACIVVERSNPVLYTYALGSKPIEVQAPDTMSSIVSALLGLAMAPVGAPLAGLGAHPGAAQTTYDQYLTSVATLYHQQHRLGELRAASDRAKDFLKANAAIQAMYTDSVKAQNAAAEALYAKLKTQGKDKDQNAVMLRAQQLESFQRATAIAEEFETGVIAADQPLCTALTSARTRIVLAIASTTKGKAETARITADSALTFDAEVVPDRDFEFGAGMMVNALARRGRSYNLRDGVVVEGTADDVLFRPAFFAHYRAWDPQWLYATVGAGLDDSKIGDAFLGLTGRFGAVSGAGISLGVGLALSRQTIGLASGAVNQPLPTGKEKVDDIVEKGWKPGVGITLSINAF